MKLRPQWDTEFEVTEPWVPRTGSLKFVCRINSVFLSFEVNGNGRPQDHMGEVYSVEPRWGKQSLGWALSACGLSPHLAPDGDVSSQSPAPPVCLSAMIDSYSLQWRAKYILLSVAPTMCFFTT